MTNFDRMMNAFVGDEELIKKLEEGRKNATITAAEHDELIDSHKRLIYDLMDMLVYKTNTALANKAIKRLDMFNTEQNELYKKYHSREAK